MTLFYEVLYSAHDWVDLSDEALNTTQPFVFSMGDPIGTGLHADFQMGWDSVFLQQVINECPTIAEAGGDITQCTLLELYDRDGADSTCQKTPYIEEVTTGTLATLPGCNPVTYTEEPMASGPNPPAFITPVVYNTTTPAENIVIPASTTSVSTSTTAAGTTTSSAACGSTSSTSEGGVSTVTVTSTVTVSSCATESARLRRARGTHRGMQ